MSKPWAPIDATASIFAMISIAISENYQFLDGTITGGALYRIFSFLMAQIFVVFVAWEFYVAHQVYRAQLAREED